MLRHVAGVDEEEREQRDQEEPEDHGVATGDITTHRAVEASCSMVRRNKYEEEETWAPPRLR